MAEAMIKARVVITDNTAKLELEPEIDLDRKALEELVGMTIPLSRSTEIGRLAKIYYIAEESNRLKRVFLVS